MTAPLGERVRIGGRCFLVIGIMEPKGQLLGFDLDDATYISVASAMDLFEQDDLNEIDVLAESVEAIPSLVEEITASSSWTAIVGKRISPSPPRPRCWTASVGSSAWSPWRWQASLASHSWWVRWDPHHLWISVHERTHEIGLLRALGVGAPAVQRLFLLESVVLGTAGGLLGLALGFGLGAALGVLIPGIPLKTSFSAVAAAVLMSLVVGAVSGVAPARRAASLDPIDALRAE